MILQEKTLTKLREMINEVTTYRSGRDLVKLFNQLGFNDTYDANFPSRSNYTDDKLSTMNGTRWINQCIQIIFDPINYVENFDRLEELIQDFNKYLAFDGWKIQRKGKDIVFIPCHSVDEVLRDTRRNNFLDTELQNTNLSSIISDVSTRAILEERLKEAEQAFNFDLYLSTIILCGSILEGVLYLSAKENPQKFNEATKAPKDREGKTKKFSDWTLSDFINVAHELGLLKENVKRFSHTLRDFRNYIHPAESINSQFIPDKDTAKICFQVLIAALNQINEKKNKHDKK